MCHHQRQNGKDAQKQDGVASAQVADGVNSAGAVCRGLEANWENEEAGNGVG